MPDFNRKPNIWERIQMDWQHDMWNSKIKYCSVLLASIGLCAVSWMIKLS